MKALIIILALCFGGCAYNSTTIYAGRDVNCTASVEKPVTVSPAASGNTVPVMP